MTYEQELIFLRIFFGEPTGNFHGFCDRDMICFPQIVKKVNFYIIHK